MRRKRPASHSPSRHPDTTRGRAGGLRRLLLTSAVAFLSTALAASGQTELPGLEGTAVAVFDEEGIPHLCASEPRDVYLLEGYVHARDRYFQMDLLRRTFSGTLAELVGPAGLDSDVQFRTLGLRRAAEATWAAIQAQGMSELVAMLEGYSQGVNAYRATHPLPLEHGALEVTTTPEWTPVDSLTVGKGLSFGLSFDLAELELTAALQGLIVAASVVGGFDPVTAFSQELFRSAPIDSTIAIDEGFVPGAEGIAGAVPKVGALAPEAAALAREVRDRFAAVPRLKQALEPKGDQGGSNWWLIAGSRSESGHAMLANDPHLALDTPSTFYEVHLAVSDTPGCGFDGTPSLVPPNLSLNVNGTSFPGAPGVVLGCNDHACWGATVNPMDVTDVYLEELVFQNGLPVATTFEGQPEPLQIVPQTFLVNQPGNGTPDDLVDAGVGPLEGGFTLVVPRRNHGPILAVDGTSALSVQYTGFGPTFEMEAFRRIASVSSVDEFRQALTFFDVGSQNFSYADVDGDIAYFSSAEMPIRDDLENLQAPDGGIPPWLIRDGTGALRHEWLPVTDPESNQALPYEILTPSEMPHVVNPADGVIINANNDPIGTTLDNNPLNQLRPTGGLYYLSPGYASLRAGSIDERFEEILAGGGKVSRDEMIAVQADNHLRDAEILLPYLFGAAARAEDPGADPVLASLLDSPVVREGLERLAAWGITSPTGIEEGYDPFDDPHDLPVPSPHEVDESVAATIWSTFRGQLVRNTVDRTLEGVGLGDFTPGSREALAAVEHLLATYDESTGVAASGLRYFVPGVPIADPAAARDAVLLESMRDALDLLASEAFAPAFGGSHDPQDYRWGKLHRIVFDHPLGGPFSIPSAAGFDHLAPALPGIARAGGYQVVDASSHSVRADGLNEFMFGSGPARRFVGVLDPDGIDGYQIIPGGQSGDPTSPHYASQLARWLTNHYHDVRLAPGEVFAAAVDVEDFAPQAGACVPSPTVLCLQNGRFAVEVDWTTGSGTGAGKVVVQSDDSGVLYFFSEDNWEMLVKVLDGCAIDGHWWVFAATASNVGWELRVTDTATAEVVTYANPLGQRSPAVTDTAAFATCP